MLVKRPLKEIVHNLIPKPYTLNIIFNTYRRTTKYMKLYIMYIKYYILGKSVCCIVGVYCTWLLSIAHCNICVKSEFKDKSSHTKN